MARDLIVPGVRLVNLTPHEVIVEPGGGTAVVVPVGGPPARVKERVERTKAVQTQIGLVPVVTVLPGPVEGLPEPADATLYIVSSLVAAAQPHRQDLLTPYDVIRDEAGRILACRALARRRV